MQGGEGCLYIREARSEAALLHLITCPGASSVCHHLWGQQFHHWSPCTPPLSSCEFRPCPGETASSPDLGVLTDAMETRYPSLCQEVWPRELRESLASAAQWKHQDLGPF